MKKIYMAAVAVAMIGTSAAFAATQDDALAMRQGAMQGNGILFGQLVGMAKGDVPFDKDKVEAAVEGLNYVSATFGNFFPEGSLTGDSEASPKIWEDAEGFKAALAKWNADVSGVAEAMPTDQASLAAAVGAIGANCKSCHESFRVKK